MQTDLGKKDRGVDTRGIAALRLIVGNALARNLNSMGVTRQPAR
jgi:hypothetical protein